VAAIVYAKVVIINAAVDTAIDFGIAQFTGEQFNLGQSLATNLAIDAVTAGVGGKIAKSGKIAGLVAKYGDEIFAVAKHLAPPIENKALKKLGQELVEGLGKQTHHLLTDKHGTKWTAEFKKIVEKYGLDLDDDWNKIQIPHQGEGGHAQQYHQWVYERLKYIDSVAQGDTKVFLEMFDEMIKQPVLDNPWVVRKDWWQAVPE
jgi:hypothetical protein